MNDSELKSQIALQEAILEVYEAVNYVQKQRVSGLNYTIATEADFIAILRPAMVKAGLTIHCEGYTVNKDETFTTKNGGTSRRIVLEAKFAITHKGGGVRRVASIGEANDSGDKACPKAQTIAQKYALRQTFLMETGDDPDVTPAETHQIASKSQPERHTQNDTAPKATNTASIVDKILAAIKSSASVGTLDAIRDKYKQDKDVLSLPNAAAMLLKLEGNYFIRRMSLCKNSADLDACRMEYAAIQNKDKTNYFLGESLAYLEKTYYACKEKISKAEEQQNPEDGYPG